MLKQLAIRNVALVDELELTFGPGLNVITGETGAGKSILIGAISLALGDRAHPDVVKDATAEVEATLDHQGIARTLKREVRLDGRTRAWIDGSSTTIGALKDEAALWVELTAQREGATLLDADSHLPHLDRFAGLTRDSEHLAELHATWQTLTARLGSVEAKLKRLAESEELAAFQLNEIESLDPQPGEEEELEKEIRLLEGAETLINGLGQTVDLLDQGEEPVSDRLAVALEELKALARIDGELKPTVELLDGALEAIRQAALDLGNRRDDISLDPERLEEVRSRHGQLIRLMRKYGGSMTALLQTLDDLRNRQSGAGDLENERAQLKREIAQHLASWEKELERVSKKRHAIASSFNEKMEEGLTSVGVQHPKFVVTWQEEEGDRVVFPGGERRVQPNGWDRIEFHISFNPGHEPKPIQRVASGGELSRVMLLLKGMGPPQGNPPVLIFDEIDTGISGRTARQVGLRLKALSEVRQVLLVTHLPQIASLADHHVVVEKETDATSTQVVMREVPIGGPEQIDEIARLLGGEAITDATRATAQELIEGK
ncbi:DNA repair protein RecN [bacterium]|nr:DNA repair protein RecN [bacterium]